MTWNPLSFPRPSGPFFSAKFLRMAVVVLIALSYFSMVLAGCKPRALPDADSGGDIKVLPELEPRPPVSFVVLIDNSKSIKPPEQVIIRETTMMLADLIEEHDRIAVITFGEAARVIASTEIKDDNDRIAFKDQIKDQADFSEKFSDLRMGLRVVAENQDALFPAKTARCMILLSDGKLEPADRKLREAYQELIDLLQEDLKSINRYAVVLGDTSCNDEIMPGVSGAKLMRTLIGSSENNFYQAKQLDQLFDIALDILNREKGIGSLGEDQAPVFKIDESVEYISLVVRKRAADGAVLCESKDITIEQPELGPGAPATPITIDSHRQADIYPGGMTSVYWSSDYQYFDYILIRKPRQGIWRVTLPPGSPARVLSKVYSPLSLRVSLRDHYFLNERAAITAWVFDEKLGERVTDRDFKIQARVARPGQIESSNTFVEFAKMESEPGRYFLEAPAGITGPLALGDQPAEVEIEILAQQLTGEGADKVDPWFVRRSDIKHFSVAEPYLDFPEIKSPLYTGPFLDPSRPLCAGLDPAVNFAPSFEAPPSLTMQVMFQGEDEQPFTEIFNESAVPAEQAGKMQYCFKPPFSEAGVYQYHFTLEGAEKAGGPVNFISRSYGFSVTSLTLPIMGLGLGLALLIIQLLSVLTAKVRAQVLVRTYEDDELVTSRPDQFNRRSVEINLGNASVTLTPRRLFFVFKSLIVTVIRGTVRINTETVAAMKSVRLRPGQHVFTWSEGNKRIVAEVNISI